MVRNHGFHPQRVTYERLEAHHGPDHHAYCPAPGAALDAHIEAGVLTQHLLEGRLRLEAGPEGAPATLAAGQLLAMHAGLPYQVVATEAEVMLLLTLAGQVRPPEAGGRPGAA